MRPLNRAEWEVRDRTDHYVYIMGHLDAQNCVTGPTKVGISVHPQYRLKQVQADEPGKIVLVAMFSFWKRAHAYRVEQTFHRACADYRLRGEWFDIEPFQVVGLMSKNLRQFQEQVLGADGLDDVLASNDYLGIPGEYHGIPAKWFSYQ